MTLHVPLIQFTSIHAAIRAFHCNLQSNSNIVEHGGSQQGMHRTWVDFIVPTNHGGPDHMGSIIKETSYEMVVFV